MTRARGFMDKDLFSKIINELRPYLLNANLYFEGESMLHQGFFEFLEVSGGIRTTVSTNGHFLSAENAEKLAKSGLKKLIISFDGSDQETYSLYRRNGNLETVREGTRNVSEAIRRSGSDLQLEVQMLVNRYNENQVDEVRRFARENKTRFRTKSMQIYDAASFSYWMPKDEKLRRYQLAEGKYVIKSTLPRRCARLWFNPVITWDGNVLPCCFDKNANYNMGSLNDKSFREIWHGELFRKFRIDLLAGREKIPICMNCTSGLKRVIL